VIAERHQIARDGQRGGAGADESNALAVFLAGNGGQIGPDVAFVVGRDALQSADRDWFLFHPAAAARRLARTVAGPPENSGKYVRLPVNHECIGVAPICNQPNVFGHRRMRWACPLAVDDFMEIVWVTDVGRLH
jgi:hypothetical protein